MECLAFYQLDPFGAWREDLRHARLMALLARINGDRHAKPKDFMLFDADEEPDNTDQRLTGELDIMFGVGNGRHHRKT